MKHSSKPHFRQILDPFKNELYPIHKTFQQSKPDEIHCKKGYNPNEPHTNNKSNFLCFLLVSFLLILSIYHFLNIDNT